MLHNRLLSSKCLRLNYNNVYIQKSLDKIV